LKTKDDTPQTRPLPTRPPILVETQPDLENLTRRLLQAERIAVDTESDGFYAYFEKVCLLQFALGDDDFLVDPLAIPDLGPLGEVFASTQVEKIFHAAEFDIICLKRDYGFRFANLFDTMIAARTLGWRRYGLANILAEQFGIQQDKRFQRINWGQRPLTRAQLEYARLDVHYLLELRDIQHAELAQRGRLEQAQEAFEQLCQLPGNRRTFDLDAYRRLPGAKELDPQRLHVLGALYRLRDQQARHLDRVPFRVIPDRTLVALGQACPRDEKGLEGIPGLTHHLRKRFGAEILRTVRRALQEQPQAHRRVVSEPMDRRARDRYQALREWRRELAESEGIEPGVILSNQVLRELARRRPTTPEELAAIPGLGDWSRGQYEKELLALLRRLR